jgi:serine/threonine protein kinase
LTGEAAAPPLAGVGVCDDVPDIQGTIEPSNDPRLPHGQVLDGRFLIMEIVGRSGAATIYRTEDLLHGRREAALKIPLAMIESDPAGFARFRNEEEIGLQLCHPFLLKFHPVDGEKSRPYLATEFLRGCTLDRLARENRPLPEMDALKITSLVCDALDYMHGSGFIHRDIKPGNIMICRDQTLRILDFGLASKPMRRRSVMAKLATPFGTPQYMAPEQVEQGLIDERTDIYCLGAVLYELLTGFTPLQDEDPWQSAYRRTTGDPIAPRKLNPAISPQAEEIVLHALQRKSGDRYASMTAFKADLDAPERVVVTGYCDRLRAPRWRLSLHATPILTGFVIGFSVIFALVVLFAIAAMHSGHGK